MRLLVSALLGNLLFALLLLTGGCGGQNTETGTYYWAKDQNTICGWESYLRQWPNGSHGAEARQAIVNAQPQAAPWTQIAQGMMDLDDIDQVYYDQEDGQLKFIGSHSGTLPPLLLDDLAECIEILDDTHRDLGVSIEPKGGINSEQVKPGEPMAIRYIPEATRNTHLGNTLFEIDRRLKSLSLGRDNVTGAAVPCRVSGFRNLPERVRDSGFKGEGGQFGLLWFEPEEPQVEVDGYRLTFRELKMRLLPHGSHPSLAEFSEHMTANFNQYADESVIFAELRRIYKLVIIARWLREAGFPLDGIRAYPRRMVQTPNETRAMSVAYRVDRRPTAGGVLITTYSLIGGVDLSPPTRYFVPPAAPQPAGVAPGTYVPPQTYVPASVSNPLPSYPALQAVAPHGGQALSLPPECRAANAVRPSPSSFSWCVNIAGKELRVVAVPLASGAVPPKDVAALKQLAGHWRVTRVDGAEENRDAEYLNADVRFDSDKQEMIISAATADGAQPKATMTQQFDVRGDRLILSTNGQEAAQVWYHIENGVLRLQDVNKWQILWLSRK